MSHSESGREREPHVAHQFEDAYQQRSAATAGMWVFLATEVMFFGGLFLAYTVYRLLYPGVYIAGSRHLDVVLGAVNTSVLITSSLTMALAVWCAQTGRRSLTSVFLFLTIVLGCAFLVIKGFEWHHKFVEHLVPGSSFKFEGADPHRAQVFFALYFFMTGLHGLHVIVGIGVISVILAMNLRRSFSAAYNTPVEITGLYWHFVDIIWIFLFPLFYLIHPVGL